MRRPLDRLEEPLSATVSQFCESALLVPQLLSSEPQRGLIAVMEHVQRCTPTMIASCKSLRQYAESSKLIADELDEVVGAVQQLVALSGPAVGAMKGTLERAAAARANSKDNGSGRGGGSGGRSVTHGAGSRSVDGTNPESHSQDDPSLSIIGQGATTGPAAWEGSRLQSSPTNQPRRESRRKE